MTTRLLSYRLGTSGKVEVKRDFGEVEQAGVEAGKAIAGAHDAAAVAADKAEKALKRQEAQYLKLAAAAREQADWDKRQQTFNQYLGVGGGTGLRQSDFLTADEAGGAGMTRQQRAGRLNLLRQGADVMVTGAMGMDPAMIAIQQGPQILDALATSGFKASGAVVALGAGVAGAAASVAALAAAQASYEASTLKLTVVANGLGAAAGLSAQQLEAQAQAGAAAGDISVRAARDMAVAYAETGKIGGGVMGDLIALTKTYGLNTRQDAAAATKELGAAFADPIKGAADLNAKLNFLSAAEEQHIQNLARSGREAEAQAILVDKLKGAMLGAADSTTGWAHAFSGLAVEASNAFDRVGQYIDRLVTGGTAAQRLTRARTGLAAIEAQIERQGGSDASLKRQKAAYELEIENLRRDFVAEMDRQRDAGLSNQSQGRQDLIDRYNPRDSQLAALRADRVRLKALGTDDPASKAALKNLDDQIQALASGYNSVSAAASAAARAQREGAKDAREAAREAEEAARQKAAFQDHLLDSERKLAVIRGDASTVDLLDRQARLQEEINRYLREGLSLEQARANARAQIGNEMQAESDALRQARSNPDGFVSAEVAMGSVLKTANVLPFDARDQFIEGLRVTTGEAFHDGLVSGLTGGSFLKVFAERLKYAAAAGLADSLTNAAFGQKSGGGGGSDLFSKIVQAGMSYFTGGIGANADGTDAWKGGLTWVGEKGPELIDLKAGAKVYSHGDSIKLAEANERGMAAVREANRRTAAAQVSGGAVVVNATFAPVLTVKGGDAEEVARLRAELEQMKATFVGDVTAAVNDGIARRLIRSGE